MNTNTTYLKTIAVFCMLVDHIGAILFPSVLLYRVIGRIAFPLFAYCIMLGFTYTHDLKRYFSRLLFWAIVCQPIYLLTIGATPLRLNVLFSFPLGLLVLYAAQKKKWFWLAAVLMLARLLPIEYGLWGILLILIFYHCRKTPHLFYLCAFVWLFFPTLETVQMFGIFSLPFICFKNKWKIPLPQTFFYYFYPVHLVLLGVVKLFI